MIKYDRNEDKYFLFEDDYEIGDPAMKLILSNRRKEILTEWLQSQLDEINEKGKRSPTAEFFTFILTPTSIGSKLVVYSHANEQTLDLSLIDDEAW